MSDIEVSFPGGKRVDAQVGGHVVRTDQPASAGGEDAAPAPFELFLASLATCAGIYVLGFCQARGLPTEGLRLVQRSRADEKGHLESVDLEILLPPGFPLKYTDAIAHAAAGCKVKRTLSDPPAVAVRARVETERAEARV